MLEALVRARRPGSSAHKARRPRRRPPPAERAATAEGRFASLPPAFAPPNLARQAGSPPARLALEIPPPRGGSPEEAPPHAPRRGSEPEDPEAARESPGPRSSP